MRLKPARVAEFRSALELVDTAAFGLADVEIFPGATIYSARSTVACRFAAAKPQALREAGAEAARLAGAKLGLEIAWGVHDEAGQPTTLWIEYFPGGADYSCARFVFQALLAAFLAVAVGAVAVGKGGKAAQAAHRAAAERELARLEKTPFQQIFVQSGFLISAARRANIPVHNVGGSSFAWQFGWGSRSETFFMTASSGDSVPGHQMTWRKPIAKRLFTEIGLPTPAWRLVPPSGDVMQAAKDVGWPCVVKPVDRAFGEGVTAHIANPAELQAAVVIARRLSRDIIVEAHEAGSDHRLMVVDGRLTGAVRRDPPAITGDGERTVAELIAALNKGRDGTRERGFLLPVVQDAPLDLLLASRGLSMDAILPAASTLVLRSVANFSVGGSATDVTGEVHPQIRGLAELLAVATGLRTAGIDYLTTDITRSHDEVGGGFIEVNAMPRLRVLMMGERSPDDVGAELLGEVPGRIPVTLIVGDSAALAELSGPLRARVAASAACAAVSAQWAQIGATELPAMPADAFGAVSTMLRHKSVAELVIAWTAEEIARFGMPVDQLARMVIIGGENSPPNAAEFCRDILVVADCQSAIEAAFAVRAS